MRCWGGNQLPLGQLGNGWAGYYPTPQTVLGSPFLTFHTLSYAAGAEWVDWRGGGAVGGAWG